jgi:hypothetical protein
MPKFKTITLTHVNKARHELVQKFDININAEGRFYTRIPEELSHAIEPSMRDGIIQKPGVYQLSSVLFDDLESNLNRLMRNANEVDVREEHVILYNIESHVSFRLTSDGEVVSRGDGSIWADDNAVYSSNRPSMYGRHHSSNRAKGGYSLCVGAKAKTKITYTSGQSKRIEFKDYYRGGSHHGMNNPAERLNSWHSFELPDNPKEIPYSDEAADFFYNLMLSMAKLSKLIQEKTFDQDVLLKTIASSSNNFLCFEANKD